MKKPKIFRGTSLRRAQGRTSSIFLSIFIFLFLSVNFFPALVSAHELGTDSSVGAVLHIDPADDPIVGQQAGIFFEFKDTEGKFKPENCNCTFSVVENGNEIYSQDLFQTNPSPSLTSASVYYTFPKKDAYELKVAGKPKTPDAFDEFNLSFKVNVTREYKAPPPKPNWIIAHSLNLIGAGIIFLFIIFSLIWQKISGRSKKQ